MLRPASNEMRAADADTFSTKVRPNASAARLTPDATVAYTSPYALSVASSVVTIAEPPDAISTAPAMSACSRPACRESCSVAAISVSEVLAEMASATATSMAEPLLSAMSALATLSSAATVAAKLSSTSSSVLAAAACMVPPSDSERLASTPRFAASEEMLKKPPEMISRSVTAREAISDANAESVPPEPICTDWPTLMSTLRPTDSVMSSAASTKRVVVSRAISCTAERSSVRLSMIDKSVEETSIAEKTTDWAVSALMSTEPPEDRPRLLAATISTVEAVRLSCSPTLVAECRPVRTTESLISSCSSSPAEERALPTLESSMLGEETLTRSVEWTCTIGVASTVSSSAVMSTRLPTLAERLVAVACSSSRTETSAEPPTPTRSSVIEAAVLPKALTSSWAEVTLMTSPAATVAVSWISLRTSAAEARSAPTTSISAPSAPTRTEPAAEVTTSPSVSMRIPAGELTESSTSLSVAVMVESSRVSASTWSLPVPGVIRML